MTPDRIVRYALVALAIVAALVLYQHYGNYHDVPPAVRDSIAVINASKRPDSIAHAAVVDSARVLDTASHRSEARADTIARRAGESHAAAAKVAQRVTEAATATDSARLWHDAYVLEVARGDQLDSALTAEKAATAEARASGARYAHADSLSQDRLARVERLNTDLVAELGRATRGCRVLPGIPCPSRTVTALTVAGASYLLLRR